MLEESQQTLQQHVEALLTRAIIDTVRSRTLDALHRELVLAYERLKQPMRIAIVGLIKAGKSTMMNALLGDTVVATGSIEATFNVNWLKYGPKASLLVHFKDGRPPEKKSSEDLERLTRRSEEHYDYLLSIKYIEVFYPREILNTLNLIDTPGLASSFIDDARNTVEFLQLHGEELSQVTQQEAANADAVLYLFSHSIAEYDAALVELFQGPMLGQATPINSIGVLTKVDAFWPDSEDAMEGGQYIVSTLQEHHPRLRRTFYSIVPMCGLLAWGAQTLTDEEFATLTQLAQLRESLFDKVLSDAVDFAKKDFPDVPILPTRREAVLDRLGQYGIWLAYRYLRSGACDRQQLAEALLHRSGLLALKDLLLAHFGNRAYLIKLSTALQQIEKTCFWARQNESIQGADRALLLRIEGEFGQLKDSEPSFSELHVLRDYYQGKLSFSPNEVQQLLQITGEFGTSVRQRLDLPEINGKPTEANLREALQKAQEYAGYWRRRSIDPGASREVESAAEVLGDAYDRISYSLMEALRNAR